MNESVRIVKCSHRRQVDFKFQLLYCFVLQELLFLMGLANLIFIFWVKRCASVKCNAIENTLSEQIGAARAKSPQTSSYAIITVNKQVEGKLKFELGIKEDMKG